jgi:hypothetical protein
MSVINQTLRLCLMVAVRRAPSGAPALDIHRSTNLRTAATHRLVAEGGCTTQDIFMFKADSATLFSVAPNATNETLITNSYETFTSVSTLLLDLSEDLNGKHRDIALAIHQLSELGVLLTARLLDHEVPCAG